MVITNKKAFTLVEMITVMVVIGVLMGLILSGSFKAINESKIEKAKAAMKATMAALDMFEADAGFYPPRPGSWRRNKFKSWLEDGWFEDPSTGWTWKAVPGTTAPYMSFIDSDLVKDPDSSDVNHYIDPWGNWYEYVCEAPYDSYYLWSHGPDGNNNSGNGSSINGDDIDCRGR
jgi:prepilin-type N-terminal cleavage/methylation domain-containing protein